MHLLVRGSPSSLAGEAVVPNSKYHAHRALILASLAEGESRVRGLSDARHVHYTVQLLRGLGTRITVDGDTFVVEGGRYRPRRDVVSAGSSGSTLYFMIGLASLAETPVTVTGQKYFRRRPVGPLLDSLDQMGVGLRSVNGCPPVEVTPHRPSGGDVHIAGTLSQWISGLLLLAPFASESTIIHVDGELNERPYLELTVAMMRQFGLEVAIDDDWRRFTVEPNQVARPTDLRLPPDIGSAAFGISAAALHSSDVLLRGVNRLTGGPADHPEVHFLDVAREMGVPMVLDEDAGGMRIQHDGAPLKPATVDCRDMPDMLPVLSTLAAFADGETVFHNVAHVRMKESDRVAAMLQLNGLGADMLLDGETLRVRGVPRLRGGKLSSFNDHRVLMSLALAASRAEGESTLTYPNAYRISYPAYLEAMNGFGIRMSVQRRKSERSALVPGQRTEAAEETLACCLPERLRRWASEQPDTTAVVEAGQHTASYCSAAELDRRVDRAAALLLRLGVRSGERVALQLPNRTEFVVIALATLRIGAVCCPLMPIFREREVSFALRRSSARVLFTMDHHRGRAHASETAAMLAGQAPEAEPVETLRHVIVLPGDEDGPARLPEVATNGVEWREWTAALAESAVDHAALDGRKPSVDMTAQLLFTSGTSGEPKGVLHRHETLNRAVSMEIRHLGLTERDSVWIPSPLAHQTGFLYGMWLALQLGVPQLLQPTWDASQALELLANEGGSFVQAATPFLTDLVTAVEEGGPAPRELRIFVATGAAVPRGLAERASRVLGTTVCGAFGTTETCLGALAAPNDHPAQRWGTDGRALDGVALRVSDDAGRVLPPGTEGNFELWTPTRFEGYLDRSDLTEQAYTSDGWYRTGDLAEIDADGFVRITGRVKDVINRGAEKIPVAEVEQLLHEHPAVREVAVVAMPDPRLGERACAFAALCDGAGLDFESMQKFLDSHQVVKQYWPERLEIVDALPRNPVGKVQKFMLREHAARLVAQPES